MLRAFVSALRAYLEFKNRPGYVLKGPPGKRRWHRWAPAWSEEDDEPYLRESPEKNPVGRVDEAIDMLSFSSLGTPKLSHVSRTPLFLTDSPLGQMVVKPLHDPALPHHAQDMGVAPHELQDVVATGAILAHRAASALGVPLAPVGVLYPELDQQGHREWMQKVQDALSGFSPDDDPEILQGVTEKEREEFRRRLVRYLPYWTGGKGKRLIQETPWVITPYIDRGAKVGQVGEGGQGARETALRLIARQVIGEGIVGVPDRNPTNYVPSEYVEIAKDGTRRSAVVPVSIDYVWIPYGGVAGQAWVVSGVTSSPPNLPQEAVQDALWEFTDRLISRSSRLRAEWEEVVRDGKVPDDPHPIIKGALDVLSRLPDLDREMGPWGSEVADWVAGYEYWARQMPFYRAAEEWKDRNDY
ncbi:hypothetical protein MN1_440 [Thermus phage MN1]|nr:hypothetical protein MN1_440 [Thermus phage MN1]